MVDSCKNSSSGSKLVLSTTYFGPVQYFSAIYEYETIEIEKWENYHKQTYRNRCYILGANGLLPLSIPVKKNESSKTLISDIKIDHSVDWHRIHLKSIESAYNSSPFYQYFIDEIREVFFRKATFLIDFNTDIQQTILGFLQINKEIGFTNEFKRTFSSETADMRWKIQPKEKNVDPDLVFPRYSQVFGEKFGFVPNLSIIDLIFNSGNDWVKGLPISFKC